MSPQGHDGSFEDDELTARGEEGESGMPLQTNSSPRGAQVEVDLRRAGRIAVGLCGAALVVITIALFFSAVSSNARIDRLHHEGVKVTVTVSRCLGKLGGSGSNGAGYTCSGTYVLDGERHSETISGATSFLAAGTQLRAVTLKDDPSALSTLPAAAAQHASSSAYLLPVVLLMVLIALLVVVAWSARRSKGQVSLSRAQRSDDPGQTSSRSSSDSSERAEHWEAIYQERDPKSLSWYQGEAVESLALLDLLRIAPGAAVLDVGGGTSPLVDQLIERGFSDVTVLDISAVALERSRRRLGGAAGIHWVVQDLLSWVPERRYDLWHDRAVFHFLAHAEVDAYRSLLLSALHDGGAVILGAFALDGPAQCSGLPVTRYGAEGLEAFLGDAFEVVAQHRQVHVTPNGVEQPFTWIAARRSSSD
jgi:hypothetical protein